MRTVWTCDEVLKQVARAAVNGSCGKKGLRLALCLELPGGSHVEEYSVSRQTVSLASTLGTAL